MLTNQVNVVLTEFLCCCLSCATTQLRYSDAET